MNSAIELSLQNIQKMEDELRQAEWKLEALPRHMQEKYGTKMVKNLTASDKPEYTISATGEVGPIPEDVS